MAPGFKALWLVTLAIVCSVCNTSSEELVPSTRLWFPGCGMSFNTTMLGRLTEVLQNCDSYEAGKKMSDTQLLAKRQWVHSAQDCHIECYVHHECVAFNWSPVHNRDYCWMLKEVGSYSEQSKIQYVSGTKDACNEHIDNDIKNYFSDPFLRQKIAKESFLEAKSSYDGTIPSRINYAKKASCLNALIEYGAISEEELGIAPALKENDEVPFLPSEGENPTDLKIDITANSGPQKIPGINQITYKNWIVTGLYAPPGKIISVTSPKILLNKFTIKIGAHTDTLYGRKHMKRDPEIVTNFNIIKENQAIGSPYGGLIFILFEEDNTFDGTTFQLKFKNVLKAPHFIFGKHTNEDWKNHIKTAAIPWTVLEIPNKLIFVTPSRGNDKGEYAVSQIDDITFHLKEWSDYMDKNDEAAGIVNRPVAEMVVIDSTTSVGAAHNGYPIVKRNLIIPGFFNKGGTMNFIRFGGAVGHELGHNMQLEPYLLHHVSVNLIQNYALPETRKNPSTCGYWGRQSRLFTYIKAGKPTSFINEANKDTEIIDEECYTDDDECDIENDAIDRCIWEDLLKSSLDLGGLGWNDLPAIFDTYRKLPTRVKNATGPSWNREERMDLWVKANCQVKKMNTLYFFKFWEFFSTESTKSFCEGFMDTPTEFIQDIKHFEDLAKEKKTCPEEEGWFGTSEKCFKIFQGKYKYKQAVKHCKDNSASLAAITGEDDVHVVNYAFMKEPFKKKDYRVWIQSVENPSVLFPYAEDYINEPNTWVMLNKIDNTQCSYAQVGEGKNRRCVGPMIETYKRAKHHVLCEKPI